MQCIKTENVLAICLILLKGEVEKSIEETLCLVEEYQLKNNRHFGIGREDFRNLFYWLGLETGRLSFNDISLDRVKKIMKGIKIKDCIDDILGFDEVYFNDEGEGWIKYENTEVSPGKQLICDFFSGKYKSEPEEVREFLHKSGYTNKLLEECSRPGESS